MTRETHSAKVTTRGGRRAGVREDEPVNWFPSPAGASASLRDTGYLADDSIATTAYLAGALEMPLLVEGPAGVGKTELAKAVARATGADLVRLQCYEGLDVETAMRSEFTFGLDSLATGAAAAGAARFAGGAGRGGTADRPPND